MRWRGREVAELSEEELSRALCVAEEVLEAIDGAPPAVQAHFVAIRQYVTIEQCRRLAIVGRQA